MTGDWQKRFGAARRAIDRRILAEAERAIGLEELGGPPIAKNGRPPSAAFSEAPDDAALQHKSDSAHAQWLQDEERDRIACAFGRPVK
jgi:hypothetical protein